MAESRLRATVVGIGKSLAQGFETVGIIQADRLRATVDLSWPRIVTGFAIMSKRTVDLAIVGAALGSTAVAGLTVANAFWMAAKFAAIGLAGGTIALVSQNYGGGDTGRASLVVEASIWSSIALAVPFVVGYVLAAEPLVGLLGDDPGTIGFGAEYLVLVAPGLLFEFVNLIASRTYAGVGDTVTPMAIRAGGALANIVLSATFVFGAGLGVAGAAIGTTLSTAGVTVAFAWGMTGHSYFGRGTCPVPLTRRGPHFDAGIATQLARVSAPLVGRRLAQGLVIFPLLVIAATFGPVAVAALGVARQVRALVNSFSWGFSIAASTLVGQRLGAGEEHEAEAFGREIAQLSLVVYLAVGAVVFLLADPIAGVFVDDPGDVALSATLIRAAAISVVPLGIDGSVTGTLRGAGDTTVPFVATLVGLYAFALPTAWAGTVTALGVTALAAALVVETVVPMVVNVWRFRTEHWKIVSRTYRPSAGD